MEDEALKNYSYFVASLSVVLQNSNNVLLKNNCKPTRNFLTTQVGKFISEFSNLSDVYLYKNVNN